MNKTKIVNRIVTVIGLSLGAFALSALAGTWTAPTLPPPNGNVDAPVNIGSSEQAKAGALGLGKSLPIISGLKLDVSGVIGATDIITTGGATIGGLISTTQLKVTGGTPSAGKVLTSSDANGNATWQTPALAGSSVIMGRAQSASASIDLPSGTWTLMINGYFGECKLTPVVIKMDGVEIGRDPSDLGDEAGCDQNTVTGLATNVAAGVHTITLEKVVFDSTDEFANADPTRSQINKRQFTWIAVKQ